ncbi:hypothetical protein BS47DRAFT_1361843 [Hydnum rufescens UP504]|uniref:Uncharacterized protein n=1 Tax=Hydnum rufescens UP504 TaxID=1448309 RepID=A0A9P6B0Y5_9AGAM|nr:hypothetical protein BS47DRAFT_1361843 [Hydnum rufescens UP504]
MAGALADVLGPVTITLCDVVLLPPISSTSVASTPASPAEANVATPSRSLDDFDCAMLGVESEEEQEDKFLDFGLGFIAGNMDVHRIDKKCDLIQKAKMDPHWNAVIKDFQAIAKDPKAPSAKQCILDIVKAAQANQEGEQQNLTTWRDMVSPNQQGQSHRVWLFRVMDGPPIEVILNLLTMFHLVISPLIVVLDLLDITLSLFVTLNLLDVTLDLLNIALDLLDDTLDLLNNALDLLVDTLDLLVILDLLVDLDLHPGNINVMMMVLMGLDLVGRTWDYQQHNQEPSKLPKAPSSPVQSASLKEQLAPSTPSGHMGVDQAPSKLPTANCPPPTHMSLDESIPQATVPNPPGQHPRHNGNGFCTSRSPPGSLDPVVPVGQWFHIKFTGVTAEVNMKEVFQSLVEDRLIGIQVRKDKFLPNLMKSPSLSVKTKMANPPVKVKRVLLAFKSQQRCDIILACFRDVPGFSPWQSTSMTALSPDHHETIGLYQYLWDAEYVEMSYVHQQSPDDLTLLLQNAPACWNIGNLRDLHPFPPHIGDPVDLKFYIHYHFLDFNWYPPLVNPEKISPSRPCILDQVEFTTLWLLALLESEYSVVQRQLSIVVHAHMQQESNWALLPFWVPLFVTGSPYDMLICEIAILAKLGAVAGDMGLKVFPTPHPRFLESCGFGDNQKWYIEWEPMELDPR